MKTAYGRSLWCPECKHVRWPGDCSHPRRIERNASDPNDDDFLSVFDATAFAGRTRGLLNLRMNSMYGKFGLPGKPVKLLTDEQLKAIAEHELKALAQGER